MLDKSQLIRIVEAAFAPLYCAAELTNYEHAFGFGVHLPDGSLITYREKDVTLLQNSHILHSVIQGIRTKIEAKGINLDSWSFPSQES